MKKTELIEQLATRTGLSHPDAAAAVDALFAVDAGLIAQAIARGEVVELDEFGAFVPRQRQPGPRPPRPGEGGVTAPEFDPGDGWREERMRGPGRPRSPGTPGGTGSVGPHRDDDK